jgi:hypothetical protein
MSDELTLRDRFRMDRGLAPLDPEAEAKLRRHHKPRRNPHSAVNDKYTPYPNELNLDDYDPFPGY